MIAPELVIIVPCYNEENRLPKNEFSAFLENSSQINICFVNDASTDNTKVVLENFKNEFVERLKFCTTVQSW